MVDNMTGYVSKRAAARDKLLDDDDTLTIAYQSGFYDGKKAAQTTQPPPWWFAVEKILEEYGLQAIDFVADFNDAMKDAAQPAQEPVGVVWLDTSHAHTVYGLQYFGRQPDKKTAMFFKDCEVGEQLYTLPPQRPWVGLTAEEAVECCTTTATQTWKNFEAKLKEKNT
jgi:hypothetical protein